MIAKREKNMGLFKKKSVTDSEVSEQIGIMEKKAEGIINDKSRFDRFLTKAAKYIRKAKKLPVIGEVSEDLATMVELLRDWGENRYTSLPVRTITLSVAALAYLLSPLDLIPDQLPIIGLIDDVSVVMGVLKLGVGYDLDKYREWQYETDKRLRRERLDAEIDRLGEVLGGRTLVSCLVSDDGELVLSVSETSAPSVSDMIAIELPEWTVRMENCDIAKFYDEVLLDHTFKWSSLGRVSVACSGKTASRTTEEVVSEEPVEMEGDDIREARFEDGDEAETDKTEI